MKYHCFFKQFLIAVCFGFKYAFFCLITSAPSPAFERTSFFRGTRAEAEELQGNLHVWKVNRFAKFSASWQIKSPKPTLLPTDCHRWTPVFLKYSCGICLCHCSSSPHTPLQCLFVGSRPTLPEASLCSRTLETCYTGLIFRTLSCVIQQLSKWKFKEVKSNTQITLIFTLSIQSSTRMI